MGQATADLLTTEDPEEMAKQQARLAVEAIASFVAHTSDNKGPTVSYDSSESTRAAYMSDVVARPIRER